MIFAAGCGSELAAGGAGLVAGFQGSKTLEGIEKDLANLEQAQLERYKKAIAEGARQDTLDELEGDIVRTQKTRETVEVGKTLLGVDWNNPLQAGGGIGLVATLAYALLTKRRLIRTEGGVTKFMARASPETAGQLYDTIARKKVSG